LGEGKEALEGDDVEGEEVGEEEGEAEGSMKRGESTPLKPFVILEWRGQGGGREKPEEK